MHGGWVCGKIIFHWVFPDSCNVNNAMPSRVDFAFLADTPSAEADAGQHRYHVGI